MAADAPLAVASEPTATAAATTAAEARLPGDPRAIRRVGVLGSGVMGAGIAAHVANAGVPVVLLDIVELNEAFAAQALACVDELGLDLERVNLDGGAIALGHPLGATGARITGKAASLLQREGKRYALATQCIGGGQGIATVLEAV